MATRKPKDTPVEPDLGEAVEPDYIDYETLNPALEQIKADLNITGDADVDCHVSKLNYDGNGTEAKIWTGDPDAFDLEKLAKTYGSGQYRVMVYMKIPSGHKVRKLNKVQAWALSPADEAKVIAARNPPAPVQQENNNALVGAMVQGFNQLGELIVKANQQPQVDPMKQMETLAGIMHNMMPVAPAAPAGPGFMEILNMVKTFNDVAGVGKPSLPADADSSTALVMAGMEMFKPVIAKAMEQKATQGGMAMPTSADHAQALLAPDAGAASIRQTDESEDFMLFKLQLKQANKAAAKGNDPADFAESIYSILPDPVLHGMAFDAAWFSYLVKAVPECEQHQAWYAKVRDALLEMGVEDGIFDRDAAGVLTLAAEPAQNGGNSSPDAPADAIGTKPAAA